MKIISDFSDFYDHSECEESTDSPRVIYFRRTQNCDFITQYQFISMFPNSTKYFSDTILNPSWSISLFVVGFCGFLIKGVKIDNYVTQKSEVSYTPTGVQFLANKIGVLANEDVLTQASQHVENYRIRDDQSFQLTGSPIFLVTDNGMGIERLVANPQLQDILFYKVFNSKDAFKSIKRFIENGLTYVDPKSPKLGQKEAQPILCNLESSKWYADPLFHGLPKGY